jgi:hypothetical protein
MWQQFAAQFHQFRCGSEGSVCRHIGFFLRQVGFFLQRIFSSTHLQICPIIERNTAPSSFFPFPNSKGNSTFYLHQKFPDGPIVCTDYNYSSQYDIKQIYFIATHTFLLNMCNFKWVCGQVWWLIPGMYVAGNVRN